MTAERKIGSFVVPEGWRIYKPVRKTWRIVRYLPSPPKKKEEK
jgi:hypothetical protein